MLTHRYVDLRALSSNVVSQIYALLVVKSTSVLKLGGGGEANFGNVKILRAPITPTLPQYVAVNKLDGKVN